MGVGNSEPGVDTYGVMQPAIRILLVDDQREVRRGLRMRLELEPDLSVVGEAADGAEAVEAARAVLPDVVIMDVEMAKLNGLAATHELHEAYGPAAVVMLSMHDDATTRLIARTAGAVSFVGKHECDERLIDAIRLAARR